MLLQYLSEQILVQEKYNYSYYVIEQHDTSNPVKCVHSVGQGNQDVSGFITLCPSSAGLNAATQHVTVLRRTFPGCVLIIFDDASEAKVGDFAHQSLVDQDVGGSQVSVDVVPLLDVRHPLCNLHAQQAQLKTNDQQKTFDELITINK